MHSTHPSELIIIANSEPSVLREEVEELGHLENSPYILCADGGAKYALALGLEVKEVIGDFDSLSADTVKEFKEKGVLVSTHSPDKDKSDLELCLERAKEILAASQTKRVSVLGAFGGRIDHFLFNLQLLLNSDFEELDVLYFDISHALKVLTDKNTFEFEAKKGNTLSLLPLTDSVTGVSSKGLRYELENATLNRGSTLSLSNVCEAELIQISLEAGKLLVVLVSSDEDL